VSVRQSPVRKPRWLCSVELTSPTV
jgi:hypothetical protein